MKPLIVIAVIAGLLGLILASQATAGVSIGAFACLLAIFARIAQAESHHREAHPRPLITPAIERQRQERLAMQTPTSTPTRQRLAVGVLIAVAIGVFLSWLW